jgi:uncharacterized protein (DUF2252 family)
MARSAHAYVRGNTEKFYEWLISESDSKIPQGPPVWICGDCHVGNLGPIANANGRTEIQIRDLDQTVIGNPAHDLVRLGLSLASAARSSDLPGVVTAQIIENMVLGYEQALTQPTGTATAKTAKPEVVKVTLRSALSRKWRHLAGERIEDTTPNIPLGKRFWSISKEERKEITSLFADEKARRMVTSLRSRDDDASVEVLDAAFWVKGCSSLGRRRYAVLLAIAGKEKELSLMDIKEAVRAVSPQHKGAKMPRDNGERVLSGAQHLSPALGQRMLAARFKESAVFVRELLPQDLKFEIEQLTPKQATKVAHFLATVVGKAHAVQMEESERLKWQRELRIRRTKTLEAPSWLWTSVVDLMVFHEGEYLNHCRRYAGVVE